MATATPLEQFSQVVLKDPEMQKQLLTAATDLEGFSKLAVELAQQKGISLAPADVIAAATLSGYIRVVQLKSNILSGAFATEASSGNTTSSSAKAET